MTSQAYHRREFLKRGAFGLFAATVATRAFSFDGTRNARAAAAMPPGEAGTIMDLAVNREWIFALAFEGHSGFSIWRCPLAGSVWERTADGKSFPHESIFSALTVVGGVLVIAGRVPEVARTLPIVDEATGTMTELEIHGSRPLIMSSEGGADWKPTLETVPGFEWAGLSCATAVSDSGAALVVGSGYHEAGIEEGGLLIALSSTDGLSWAEADVGEVPTPQHGCPTLLAHTGSEILLGIAEMGGPRLHSSANASGPWREVAGPHGRHSYVAAAGIGEDLLLAGVDEQYKSHVWRLSQDSWTEIADADPSTLVMDMENADGELIGVASQGGATRVVAIDELIPGEGA